MSGYLYRMLQQKLPGVLRKRLRPLPFEDGSLIPTIADLDIGAKEIIRDRITEVGEANIMGGDSGDIPLVEVTAAEDTYRAVMVAAAFSYSFTEEMAADTAQRNGVQYNLRTTKQETAARVIAEKLNYFAAYGDTGLNVRGLVNNASVTLNNTSFNPFGSVTPDDLANFFLTEIQAIATSTNNVEFPTEALVSTDLYYKLIRTRMPDSAMNVLDYILGINRASGNPTTVQRITPLNELRSTNLEAAGVQAGSTNKDRIVLYPLNDSVLSRHNRPTAMVPAEYTYTKNMQRYFPMYACTSQTMIEYPAAFRYVDHVKAA